MITFTTDFLDRAIWEGSRELWTTKPPSGLRMSPKTWQTIATQQTMDSAIDWVGYTYGNIPVILDQTLDFGEVEVVWAFRKTYLREVPE